MDGSLKVLFVVESHAKHAGGGPIYWAQLSDWLQRRGHQVQIVSGITSDSDFASPNTVGLLPVRSDLRSRSWATIISRYRFRRRYLPMVYAFARKWQPDIIHTVPPIASEAALGAGKKLGIPVVASILSHVEAQWAKVEANAVKAQIFRHWEARAIRGPFSRLICLTHRSEQVLQAEGIPVERIAYVPHAVDMDRFGVNVAPRFRPQLGLSKDAFIIGYAGALSRDKGFDVLIRAMSMLAQQSNLHLVIAGTQPIKEVKKLIHQAKGLTNIHFLGFVEHLDMPALMASLDLYVIPSLTETLPTTLLEALAMGTPVMAATVGGVTEFMNKGFGIALAASDTALVVKALEEWMNRRTELQQMGKAGQRYVRKHHNWDRSSRLTEEVYLACLSLK